MVKVAPKQFLRDLNDLKENRVHHFWSEEPGDINIDILFSDLESLNMKY